MNYKKYTALSILCLLLTLPFSTIKAQESNWAEFDYLIGNWIGSGEGFSSGQSSIQSSFEYLMNNKYIKVTNRSVFKPSDKSPEGSIHEDWGIISYDKNRKVYVFRQFHNEGFVNHYILNDSLSNDLVLIFETEVIENFVEGGTARFTIIKHEEEYIETVFDVSFPGKDYTCFGRNELYRK